MSLQHLPDDDFFYGILRVLHLRSSQMCACGEPADRGFSRCHSCRLKKHATDGRRRYAENKIKKTVSMLLLMLTVATSTTIGLTELRIEEPWLHHNDLAFAVRLHLTAWEDAR